MAKKGPGRPPHEPTDETRGQVEALASFGVRQDAIASYIGISKDTLHKYYRRELDTAEVGANAAIARRLYAAAVEEGNVSAMIFWLKARAGWSEKQQVEHSGELPVIVVKREG